MQYFVKIVLGYVEFGKFIRTNKVSDKKKDAGMRNVSGGCRLVEHLSPPCHAGACAHVPGQDMRPRGRLRSDFGRQCLALNQPVQRGCLQTAVSLCDTGSLVIIKKKTSSVANTKLYGNNNYTPLTVAQNREESYFIFLQEFMSAVLGKW